MKNPKQWGANGGIHYPHFALGSRLPGAKPHFLLCDLSGAADKQLSIETLFDIAMTTHFGGYKTLKKNNNKRIKKDGDLSDR